MANYVTAKERDLFFEFACETLGQLQLQEDKPYQVRKIAEAMVTRDEALKDESIDKLTYRLGSMMATRSKKPDSLLEKTRNTVSNDLGGNYFYYLKSV